MPPSRPDAPEFPVETTYFGSIVSSAAAPSITDGADAVFRNHLELAAVRSPGTANLQLYRPGDGSGLGAAVQIVNDDMPMLVDAVTSALRRIGVSVVAVIHPVFDVVRDGRGNVRAIASRVVDPKIDSRRELCHDASPESWIHVQLDSSVDAETLARIEATLQSVLGDLRRVADDSNEMRTRIGSLAERIDHAVADVRDAELSECAELLRWLNDGHFTLLGYARDEPHGTVTTGLGLLRVDADAEIRVPVFGPGRSVLRVTNGSGDALLPGSGAVCFVNIVEPAIATGEPDVGGHVFVGALTVSALHENVLDIPVVSRRVRQVIEWAGCDIDSFSGQAMLEVLQSFPRAELFAIDARQLFETVSAVMNLRRQVRLFLRHDARSGVVFCLVYLPRERYANEVRLAMQEILVAEFGGAHITYSTRVTESENAVVNFTIDLPPDADAPDLSEPNRKRLQELLFATTHTWTDRVVAAADGSAVRDFENAFPVSYQQDFSPDRALRDIRILERLAEGDIDVRLSGDAQAPAGVCRFTLYVAGEGITLSRVLPVLHSLGADVVDERPYRIDRAAGTSWVYEFGLRIPPAGYAEESAQQRFCDAFRAIWFGRAEVDALNELVLVAGLHWREVAVLRAYAKYLQQAGFPYSFGKIGRVLRAYPDAVRLFVELFAACFDPDDTSPDAARRAEELAEQLQAQIDAVVSLDVDRVLRAVLGLITATLRTNYFRDDHGEPAREQLSFKFDARQIAETPEPKPQFEIFVYSPRIEGVHLRFGRVARGGLRWSDRIEDFRTEILGLVKAQAVKNAVIVPVGAKGGFIVKQPPEPTGDASADRAALRDEAVACYRKFVAAMLDLTDNVNRADRSVVPPHRVVRRDGDDTYLVLAADKGTATFSDIANDVASRYDFWLGDAFASGGSSGYDHKAMGITARGAWVSVERHFAESGIDVDTQDFTVVGIGDMSGDVFGNGMLASEHIKLVAAFDHRHIFLDPDPDPGVSYRERRRLFELERSSWADYDVSAISPGGGVYDRTAKAIPVTPQVRAALGLDAAVTTLSSPEMIRAILLAPVDLLWNGGIGTYVKASTEPNAEVGDKSNDAVRVDANRLRVKIIGEGGNLGVSTPGRVEFCVGGGRMNTDALDNSAGVACSDHEVNIKILLEGAITGGELARHERDQLLTSMTSEVATLVLNDNVAQNVGIGLCRAESVAAASVHRRLLNDLEARRGLNRTIEGLPSDEEFDRRIAEGRGLTSPELANLIAHVKLSLKADLLAGDLPGSAVFAATLQRYFPEPLRERFAAAIGRHGLRREIVATVIVNEMVDFGGLSYAFRLAEDVAATTDDAVRAFTVVSEIFDLRGIWHRIRTAPASVAVRDEFELETRRTLDRASRWLLANRPQPVAVGADIARYRDGVGSLAAALSAAHQNSVAERACRAADYGHLAELSVEVFGLVDRYPLFDVIDIAEIADREVEEVVALYYALADRLGIERLLEAVNRLDDDGRWGARARLMLHDDLYSSLRALTLAVLAATEPGDSAGEKIGYWESTNQSRFARSRTALSEIFAADTHNLAMLSVAARQVGSLAHGG